MKEFERYKEGINDPKDQCQAVTPKGQCLNLVVENTTFCECHGGRRAAKQQERQRIRNYNLLKWKNRLDEKAESDTLKSLRDEIVILRLLIENIMIKCQDESDLLMYSAAISDLVMKVEKVVTSCNKLESSLGQLVDIQALLQFANEVISILSNHIDDPEVLEKISVELLSALG